MATVDMETVTAATSHSTGPETTLVFLNSGDVLHVAMDYWMFYKLWHDPSYDPDKEQ